MYSNTLFMYHSKLSEQRANQLSYRGQMLFDFVTYLIRHSV